MPPPPSQISADKLTLFQTGGQIMPTTLIPPPRIFRIALLSHYKTYFVCSLCFFSILYECKFLRLYICTKVKDTKGRSSGQTPFTQKPKQLALKKTNFNPPKILPKFNKKKFHFCIKRLFSANPTM